jgi:hypothetical protein
MKRPSRFVARVLLAASLAGVTATHRHSILEVDASPPSSVSELAPRCELSTTLSFHAIPRIAEGDVCWACHWYRLFAVSPGGVLPEPVDGGEVRGSLPPRAAENVARFTRLSRGPPTLL